MKYEVGDRFTHKGDKMWRARIVARCNVWYKVAFYSPTYGRGNSEYWDEEHLDRHYDKMNRLEKLVLFGEV